MKTFSYEILQNEFPSNPRDEFDNMSTFYAVKNSRYITGGKKDLEFTYREDLEDEIKSLRKEGAVIVECHNNNTGTFYAVVERSQLKKEYLDYGYSMRKALYHARKVAEGEAKEYNAWADGEVYGYKVTDDETGEEVDSCWGFYGYEYCKEEAESIVKWHNEQAQKEESEITSRLNTVTL